MEYLLKTVRPQSDWIEERKRFLATLAEFERLKAELVELELCLKRRGSLDNEQRKISEQVAETKEAIEIRKIKLSNYEATLEQIEATIEQNKFQLEETKKLEPKWYVLLLECFKKKSSYQKWSDKCANFLDEIFRLSQQREKLKLDIAKSWKLVAQLEKVIPKLLQKKQELDDAAEKNREYISSMREKYSWSSEMADEVFWQSSDQNIQLSSPWIHKELQDLRAQVFVEAMKLHYSFIINSSEYILNNLRGIRQVLSFEVWPPESKDLLKHLWAVFFLVVPSVSTTFASFYKLFKGLDKAESLGWLLIDEAGQSAPQEALGAIFRAKRAIVVGDPLQIRPVVTISKAINDTLLKYFNVAVTWSVLEESVQTLSDRTNTYGTDINGQWVGCPLRVHRRCLEPMFSVANNIAYDNLMIQATPQKSSVFDQVYPESHWIDVQSNEFDGHWCKKQGEEVLKIIQNMITEHNCLPDLYIISPFKMAAYKMQLMLREKEDELLAAIPAERLMFGKWVSKSVGTVHTFQGKQSEGVVLLLGGNPSKPGAINWASKHPNILNVALTRAKYKFFVIGNYKLWASKPYFQVLANAISCGERGAVRTPLAPHPSPRHTKGPLEGRGPL